MTILKTSYFPNEVESCMFERNLRIKCIALELANVPDMSFLGALAKCIVLAKAYGAWPIVRLNSSFLDTWTALDHCDVLSR
jgi:hypothetical protein